MWANCCLPMNFIERMFAKGDPTATPPVPEGYINQRLSGADNTYQHRKTSVGSQRPQLGPRVELVHEIWLVRSMNMRT